MKTKIPKRLPAAPSLDSAEREYLRRIRLYVRTYQKLMREGLESTLPHLKRVAGDELPEARTDAMRMDINIEKSLASLMDRVMTSMRGLFPDSTLVTWTRAMVGHVNLIGKRHIVKTAKTVDLDIEPLMKDGELSPYFQNVVDENVGLIRSIPEARLPAFKNQLVALVTSDAPVGQIRDAIQDHFDLSDSRARLIARDQVGKLNGRITQYRQEKLGGKRYRWITSHDERVRKDHKKLDGKIFYWNNPPVVDRKTGRRANPGYDFQCRCVGEMVFEDIVS